MDDLAAFGISYLASKGLDLVLKIGPLVLQKCAERRSVHFLESFLKELESTKNTDHSLSQVLDKYFEDEIAQEFIFSAYRRVIFSASKEIGPKIIGLLTAEALVNGSNTYDEKACLVAESFDDDDFIDLDKFLKTKGLSLQCCALTHSEDHSTTFTTNCSLREEWENWRIKLFRLALYEEWSELNIEYRSEVPNDEYGSPGIDIKQKYTTEFCPEIFHLMDYYHRIIGEKEC